MGQPSSVIKLFKSGRQSVDAKNGAQDRCGTEKKHLKHLPLD